MSKDACCLEAVVGVCMGQEGALLRVLAPGESLTASTLAGEVYTS